MEEIIINKYYTDDTGKILFIDATLTLTDNATSKSASDIFSVNIDEYNEDVVKKRIYASYPAYRLLQEKVQNLFKVSELTETVLQE